MTIGPPVPEIQFDLENSRSKVKVKGTPVSAVSSWLISLLFHIRASYQLPSLSFNDNWASHSIWPGLPYNLTLKIQGQSQGQSQGQRYPSQHSIQLTHFLFVSHQLDKPFKRYGRYKLRQNFSKIESGGRHDTWNTPTQFFSDWISGSHFIVGTR